MESRHILSLGTGETCTFLFSSYGNSQQTKACLPETWDYFLSQDIDLGASSTVLVIFTVNSLLGNHGTCPKHEATIFYWKYANAVLFYYSLWIGDFSIKKRETILG